MTLGRPRIDDERVAELTMAGWSARRIAEELGCHRRAVDNSRKRTGVYVDQRRIDDEQVVQLTELGWSIRQIANELGFHHKTIEDSRKRSGVHILRRTIDDEAVAELTNRGFTAKQIAEKLHFSQRAVERARARNSGPKSCAPRLTADELARAGRLLDDGASLTEVARTIGRSQPAIRHHFPGRGWDSVMSGRYARMVSPTRRR